jgi:peptide deformylase
METGGGPPQEGAREKILLLGDPGLRAICEPVTDFDSPDFKSGGMRLLGALERFRREQGFGRGIAAPQIGIPRRMIALNLGAGPFLVVNPVLSALSERRFTLWDDCMSFPWLMVRLERRLETALSYIDERGKTQRWERLEPALSELLQHEVDHLDGILAVDRALDKNSIVAREVYLERRRFFDQMVDYTIAPTIPSPTSQSEQPGEEVAI